MKITTLQKRYNITLITPISGAVKCNECGAVWAFRLRSGGRREIGWWKCPKGCNLPIEHHIEVARLAAVGERMARECGNPDAAAMFSAKQIRAEKKIAEIKAKAVEAKKHRARLTESVEQLKAVVQIAREGGNDTDAEVLAVHLRQAEERLARHTAGE